MSLVFDTSALMAQSKREPGAVTSDRLLTDGTGPRLIHAVDLCEVNYLMLRSSGRPRAERMIRRLTGIGLETRNDSDAAFWRAVARFTQEIPPASLADCFVIALAERTGATVVTADRPSFRPVVERSICAVTFIR